MKGFIADRLRLSADVSDSRNGADLCLRDEVLSGRASVPQRILVPTDFGACSAKALETAVAYAQRFGARVTLLHVIDIALDFLDTPRFNVEELEKNLHVQAQAEFTKAIQPYTNFGVAFETIVAEGLPHEEIIEVARKWQVGVIVMGKHPDPKFWSLFHRHTVQGVLANADCEVVVVMDKSRSKAARGKPSEVESLKYF